MSALAIISGGMDSVTMLRCFKDDISIVAWFDYGQKHGAKEKVFSELHAKELGKTWIEIPLLFINKLFKSDLLQSGGEIPEGHYADKTMIRTVVPFRNGIMLSIAAGLAESHSCSTLMIANHFGDHAIYPDCRANFIKPMSEAMYFGTYAGIRIKAPFTDFTKRDIAIIGQENGVDWTKTWSCYKGKDIHCGKCGTCVERKEALFGFDPTEYTDKKTYEPTESIDDNIEGTGF